MVWPSPARARWLGDLYQAAASGRTLSHYSPARQLSLGELLAWGRRLINLLVAASEGHCRARLVAVEVAA